MLRVGPGLVAPDHLVGGRVDDGHRGTAAVRHVDPVRHPPYRRAEHVRPGVGVDVRRISHRRHPRQRHRQVRHGARDLPGRSRIRRRADTRGRRHCRVRRPGGIARVRKRPEDHRKDRDHGHDGQRQATEPDQAPGLPIHRPASPAHADPLCGVYPLPTPECYDVTLINRRPFRAVAAGRNNAADLRPAPGPTPAMPATTPGERNASHNRRWPMPGVSRPRRAMTPTRKSASAAGRARRWPRDNPAEGRRRGCSALTERGRSTLTACTLNRRSALVTTYGRRSRAALQIGHL